MTNNQTPQPVLDVKPAEDQPKDPSVLVAVESKYLWTHFRFELTLPMITEPHGNSGRPHPLYTLLWKLAGERDREVAKIRRDLEKTRLACEELLTQLDSDDELSESRHVSADPDDLVNSLQAMDHRIGELVFAVKAMGVAGG